jgi:hypothetical protein
VERVRVVVSIDTEEDDWGSYKETGATVRNIVLLPTLQARLDRWDVRPTYFVNYPPLTEPAAVSVLRDLSRRSDLEIGTHCHIWNTPPYTGAGESRSMMWRFPVEVLRAKLLSLTDAIESHLGVHPVAFRSGKWSFGPTVAEALHEEGYEIDSSVTPFIDWSRDGGPDFSTAPQHPYRFHPQRPQKPDDTGTMLEIPTTIGFLRGRQERSARWRRLLENGVSARFGVVGILDRSGLLAKRWLSPESSTGPEMIRLAQACVDAGARVLVVSLHSSVLLPGATPVVADEADRERLLAALDTFLAFCTEARYEFATMSAAHQEASWERAADPLRASGSS